MLKLILKRGFAAAAIAPNAHPNFASSAFNFNTLLA
jgi:hypothetical protein